MIESEPIKALHVHLEGFTAFFRVPWSITTSQLTTPCPTYSNILGLLSACTNKIVRYTDTRIGFEFKHANECEELELADRFQLVGTGDKKYLITHRKGQKPMYSQVHFKPELDLYLTNLDFYDHFYNPSAPFTLGRSQDLCWIKKLEFVNLIPAKSGNIGSTMINNRFLEKYISPNIFQVPEWFDNDVSGEIRRVGKMSLFQAISPDSGRVNVTMNHLYHPDNLPDPNDVIYLHEWSTPLIRAVSKK